jgi:hypothetical protein
MNEKLRTGFPIFTKDNVVRIVEQLDADPILLLPFKEIGIDEGYEEIVPENRILNPTYFSLIRDEETTIFKEKTVKTGLCADNLVQKTQEAKMKKEKLKAIMINSDDELKGKEHQISSKDKDISTLLFWNDIVGRISQVPDRAQKFFDVLLKVVCTNDENWKRQIQVTCSCEAEKHEIIPAEWLANIKCDSWIPILKGDEEEAQIVPREATRENVENLLSSEKIKEAIQSDTGIELLSHLGFEKLDLKIKRKSIDLEKPEKEIREELAKVSDRDDVLSLVQYPREDITKMISGLAESKENERQAQENQATGRTVEQIVREILTAQGIKPEIIYEGADIEIWPAEEGWDGGAIDMEPYLIEIKFTTGNRVRISRKQAEVAKQVRKNFFVLVVEGDSTLKEKMLDYDELSPGEQTKIAELIKRNSHIIPGIAERLVEAPTPEEVEPDINGYWIKKGLWQRGERLTSWIATLKSTITT